MHQHTQCYVIRFCTHAFTPGRTTLTSTPFTKHTTGFGKQDADFHISMTRSTSSLPTGKLTLSTITSEGDVMCNARTSPMIFSAGVSAIGAITPVDLSSISTSIISSLFGSLNRGTHILVSGVRVAFLEDQRQVMVRLVVRTIDESAHIEEIAVPVTVTIRRRKRNHHRIYSGVKCGTHCDDCFQFSHQTIMKRTQLLW